MLFIIFVSSTLKGQTVGQISGDDTGYNEAMAKFGNSRFSI